MTTVTSEPQLTDDLTRTNPAMITTFTTSEVTTSEIATAYDSISQDLGLANVTITGLGKSYSCNT